jgi:hypothetical protein
MELAVQSAHDTVDSLNIAVAHASKQRGQVWTAAWHFQAPVWLEG